MREVTMNQINHVCGGYEVLSEEPMPAPSYYDYAVSTLFGGLSAGLLLMPGGKKAMLTGLMTGAWIGFSFTYLNAKF